MRDSTLVCDLNRLVVGSSTSGQIILIFGEIGELQIWGHGRPRWKNDVGDISFLAIQQMVAVVAYVPHGHGLTRRKLVLQGAVPLLDIGCLPRAIVADESQPFGTEVRTGWVGIRRCEPVLQCRSEER